MTTSSRRSPASGKIVRYLDIPIQHASDRVLKAMRRPDTRDALSRLVESLRTAMSDIVLRTTVIVGFPGETQEDFGELLEFIRAARFDALGAFTYFPEAGTPAAEMPDQVPDEVKQARFDELMLAQQEIAFARNKNRIGSRLECLVDSLDGIPAEAQVGGPGPQAGDVSMDRPRISTAPASSRDAPRPRDNSSQRRWWARRTTICAWSKFDIEAAPRPL